MGKYALLIGVSDYQHLDGFEDSLTAQNDVKALREVFTRAEIGRFADVQFLLNPRKGEMEEAIEDFFQVRKPEDLATLVFVGRGMCDSRGRAYLLTHNSARTSQGEVRHSTVVAASTLQTIMDNSPARQQVMILDCGFTGGFAGAAGDAAAIARSNGSLNLKGQLGGTGRVIMLGASAAAQIPAFASHGLSPYAHLLQEGILTGKADRDGDRQISAHDLHTYICEHLPAHLTQGRPELISQREEDSHLPWAQVPVATPAAHNRCESYKAQVKSRIEQGYLSSVGRAILDAQRKAMGLSQADALAIETEVLRPYREHEANLRHYRQTFQKALQERFPLSPKVEQELQDLQALLQLTPAQVAPIQEEVRRPFEQAAEQHQQHCLAYEQSYQEAIAHAYPLADATLYRLRQRQHTLGLSTNEAHAIESRVVVAEEQQRQQYQHHLQRLEEGWQEAVAAQFPPDEATYHRMQKLQLSLGVQDADAWAIAQTAIRRIEQQRATHQANRHRYEAEFLALARQTPALGKAQRDRLQRWQTDLNLTDADILEAEDRAIAILQRPSAEQATHQKRYEQECARLLQEECPLSEAHQDTLRRLQEDLHLADTEVQRIQQQLTAQAIAHRETYATNLQHYAEDFRTALSMEEAPEHGVSADARQQLDETWQQMRLKPADVAALESRIYVELAPQSPAATLPNEPQAPTPHAGLTPPGTEPQEAELKETDSQETKLQGTDPQETVLQETDPQETELSETEQKALEAQELLQKKELLRHMYGQSYRTLIQVNGTLSEKHRSQLNALRQSLDLSPEEAQKIEGSITDVPPLPIIGLHSKHDVPPDPPTPDPLDRPVNEPSDSFVDHPNNDFVDDSANDADIGFVDHPNNDFGDNPGHGFVEDPSHGLGGDLGDRPLNHLNDSVEGSPTGETTPQVEPDPTDDFGFDSDENPVPTPTANLSEDPSTDPLPLSTANLSEELMNSPVPSPDAGFVSSSNGFQSNGLQSNGLQSHGQPISSEEQFSDPNLSASPVFAEPTTASDNLASEREIDYSHLQGYLQEKDWAAADRETLRVMLKASHRQKEGWLSPMAIQEFPCTDLRTISQLWEKYSAGHFGFYAQEHIYREFFNASSSQKMGDRSRLIEVASRLKWVWKLGNLYPLFRRYDDLDFHEVSAAIGHLPALWFWQLSFLTALKTGTIGNKRDFAGSDIKMFSSLMQRIKECNLP